MQLHSICMSGELSCVYFFTCWNASQGTCALINKTLVNCTRTKENTCSAFLFPSWVSLRHSPGSECLELQQLLYTASRNMLFVCMLFICWNKSVRNCFDDVFMCELHVKDIALHGDSCSAPRFSIKHWHDLNVFSCLFRWIIKILWPTFLLLVNTLND